MRVLKWLAILLGVVVALLLADFTLYTAFGNPDCCETCRDQCGQVEYVAEVAIWVLVPFLFLFGALFLVVLAVVTLVGAFRYVESGVRPKKEDAGDVNGEGITGMPLD